MVNNNVKNSPHAYLPSEKEEAAKDAQRHKTTLKNSPQANGAYKTTVAAKGPLRHKNIKKNSSGRLAL
ncbi:MAG: hypothetical protein ACE5EZ_02040 [Thermodesulfobacteriota bacterium]